MTTGAMSSQNSSWWHGSHTGSGSGIEIRRPLPPAFVRPPTYPCIERWGSWRRAQKIREELSMEFLKSLGWKHSGYMCTVCLFWLGHIEKRISLQSEIPGLENWWIKNFSFLHSDILGSGCNMCRSQDLVSNPGVPCGKAHMGIT